MINTESYGERNNNSDEEDLKPDIPFFHDPSDTSAKSEVFSEESLGLNLEATHTEDNCSTYKFQNWESDEEYGGDSRIDSIRLNTTDSGKYFSSTETPCDIKQNTIPAYNTTRPHQQQQHSKIFSLPEDPVFRPPSTSTLNYSYQYSNSMNNMHHSKRPSQTPNYDYNMTSHPQSHAGHQQQTHGYSSNPSYHSNMWYPNAPYSTGSYYPQYGQQRYPGQYNAGYPQDPMVDMLQLSNSGREARNRAEKNRRDKLNGSIQELSTMVPHVAESPRRVDKTAVLRFAAHGLRLQYVFGDAPQQSSPQITDSLMKLLDSFCITVTCHGQIVLISSSIEHHLGHCQADLYGQNILHITHPEDHLMVKQQLIPTDLESLFDIQPDDNSDEPRPRTQEEEDYIDKKLREDKRSFTVRLARAGPRSEPTAYEVVKLDGCFRRSNCAPRGLKTSSFPSGLQLIRRTRGRDDTIPLHTISGNDIVLIAVGRIIRPPKVVNTLMEANNLEYKTRHLIDGRIIDCDQRIGLVAGYMTDEVRTLSPFTFMHQDDVRWVIVALRQMYDCNSSYGESTYRLLTRNGNFIYLRSKGYLEIDKDTNKVHSFVCINTLLDEEEGKKSVQEMKHKFSAIIDSKIPSSSVDVPASAKPHQLEKAVLCLIQNLQKSVSSDGESELDNEATTTSRLRNDPDSHMSHASLPARSISSCSVRSTKTPPLSLVPPETASVRTSISKSVSIVNITAARHLREHLEQVSKNQKAQNQDQEGLADDSIDEYDALSDMEIIDRVSSQRYTCNCLYKNDASKCENCEKQLNERRISNSNPKRSVSWSDNEEELKPPKRRLKSTEIQHVLSSSLDQVRRSLDQQLNAAKELRDQSNKYEIPNSNQRIEEWMEEHQKQEEIFVNIKSEYEVQMQNNNIDDNATKSTELQVTDDLKLR